MPAIVALWLLVAALLTCAGLCWLQAGAWSLQIALLDLYALDRPRTVLLRHRPRWVAWRGIWRVVGGLFVLTAAADVGVALRWW